MDFTELANVVANIGFPMAVCLICFWYINKMQCQHKEEMDGIREALNNNTLVMQKLVDKLGAEE